jgi:3,2-trans-enoyl-CoA isomerase
MLELTNHGQVREIRLARPPVNALNPELVQQLILALKQAGEQAGAIVLSGRSGLFSAGLDVPELMRLNREGMSKFWLSFFQLLETIARSPVPVAAAVTGHAPAGGAVISLFCDYRAMSAGEYRIGLNETRVGLVIPPVIQRALVRLVGAHRAERMLVAGAMLNPQEALQAGLVDTLCDDPDETVLHTLAWCNEHLELPQHAMLGNRALARTDLCAMFDDFSTLGVEHFVSGWFSDETQASLNALLAQLASKQSS